MKGANSWKLVFVIVVVLAGLVYLSNSVMYYSMSAEERLNDPEKAEKLLDKSFRLGLDIQGGLHLVMEIDTTQLGEDIAEPPIDECEAIIRNRIDQFGVTEPIIQKVGNKRLIVDLPGIQNAEVAKELLQETALLEFKLVRSANEVAAAVRDIDRLLNTRPELLGKDKVAEVEETEVADAEVKEEKTEVKDVIEVASEEKTETKDEATPKSASDIFDNDSLAIPGMDDGNDDMESDRPFSALVDAAGDMIFVPKSEVKNVERIIALDEVKKVLPRGTCLTWGDVRNNNGMLFKELFLLTEKAELTGDKLDNANFGLGNSADPRNASRPVVNLTFSDAGRKIFSRVTGANIKRRLAIVLNDRVYTAPTIQNRIQSNSAQITGINSLDEAKMIAIILKAGALPAPLNIVEERTVGPTLGQDSIKKGISAALIGSIIVLLSMLVYYKASGLVANVAIVLNMILLMAAMALLKSTLTLPGIAGIILTVGMALDANVLIFERIREELASGKTVRAAIDAGYSRAFRTIFDANLTTLITAVILYYFGTGPVRGFALTLSIGIVFSMFTAIFVTRIIFEMITAKYQPKTLSI